MEAWVLAPGGAIILALIIITRGLIRLQNKIDDHAERIAHIEGEMHRDTREG